MAPELGVFDLTLLVLSILVSVLIGLYFANKNKSIESYMIGDGKLSMLPVALSLMTSCMSGLTLLGSSAELYYQGPTYGFIVVAILLSGPITAYTVLPVFYRMNELSLYKYLNRRYGPAVKYLVTTIYMLHMVFYNSVVLYLPSLALQSVLGISKFYSILVIGIMCVVYSGIGGLKAVVWTDLFQALLMYSSVIAVGAIGTYEAGGFLQVMKISASGDRLNFDGFFNFDLTTRHTLFGVLVGSTLKHVYVVGVNQIQMQRTLSLPSLKEAQGSFILCSLFTGLISLLSTYLGLVMYSAYKSCDPFMANEISRRDAAIVHYVAHRLAKVPGLNGIFIAGIFSATLSTLSSYANSMSALALEDFIKPSLARFGKKDLNQTSTARLAKILATGAGLICVLMAYVIDKTNSRLLQVTTTLTGAIGIPFLASFLLGIFTRYTNTVGIMISFAITLPLGCYIAIYQTFFTAPLEPQMPVYYDDSCAKVFNNTMDASLLPSSFLHLYEESPLTVLKLPQVRPPFTIDQISYMTLPVVQFALTILIASSVSLLTGGLNQEIEDECLVSMKHVTRAAKREKNDLLQTGFNR